jgi:hypothetical protein
LCRYGSHGANEGIVKLITLMVKGNETITIMKVLQLHIKKIYGHDGITATHQKNSLGNIEVP